MCSIVTFQLYINPQLLNYTLQFIAIGSCCEKIKVSPFNIIDNKNRSVYLDLAKI